MLRASYSRNRTGHRNVRGTDGVEENRRVEIESSDPRILDPVWTTDTVRTVTPPALRFSQQLLAERGMASWTIMASQGGKQIKQLDGNGQPPKLLTGISKTIRPIFRGRAMLLSIAWLPETSKAPSLKATTVRS
ncbi:MAG: hypothetical protein IPI24_02790 [Ignavibacteria bacterium]|nr:hypothetical protein [Ignavibacteria bacterium]